MFLLQEIKNIIIIVQDHRFPVSDYRDLHCHVLPHCTNVGFSLTFFKISKRPNESSSVSESIKIKIQDFFPDVLPSL